MSNKPEIYASADVEADEPIPGPYSMLDPKDSGHTHIGTIECPR
jgi:hypothetical protein